jgi:hypothetical protein
MVMVASITVSHMRLSGKIDVLVATNAIDHKYFKEELQEITTAVVRAPLDNYAEGGTVSKRKKKTYAGEPVGFDYAEDRTY